MIDLTHVTWPLHRRVYTLTKGCWDGSLNLCSIHQINVKQETRGPHCPWENINLYLPFWLWGGLSFEFLHPRMPCGMFGWNWPSVSKEETFLKKRWQSFNFHYSVIIYRWYRSAVWTNESISFVAVCWNWTPGPWENKIWSSRCIFFISLSSLTWKRDWPSLNPLICDNYFWPVVLEMKMWNHDSYDIQRFAFAEEHQDKLISRCSWNNVTQKTDE